MAYSSIEDKYLSALTAVQFPEEPPAPVMPEQTGAMGTMPGDIQLAEVGSRNLPERAYTGYNPDSIKAVEQSTFEKALQNSGIGLEQAGRFLDSLGQVDVPLLGTISLSDFVPFVGTAKAGSRSVLGEPEWQGTPMALQQAGTGQSLTRGTGFARQMTEDASLAAMDAAFNVIPVAKGIFSAGKALAPKAGEMAANIMEKGGVPIRGLNIVENGPLLQQGPVLNRQEKAIISAGAGRKTQVRQEATNLAENLKTNYSEADGWAPIEINKVEQKFDKAGKYVKVEVDPKAISYDFHTPPKDVPVEAWQATMSSRVLDEVQTVVDRAAGGDKAALDILAEASWYRTMRDRLRTEFGGLGDVFADVLGTTSAQTDVRQNFKNAIAVLTKFSRGDYDPNTSSL